MLVLAPTLIFVGLVVAAGTVGMLFLPWWLDLCVVFFFVYLLVGLMVFLGVLSGPVVFDNPWQLFWQSLLVVFGWPWVIWGTG